MSTIDYSRTARANGDAPPPTNGASSAAPEKFSFGAGLQPTNAATANGTLKAGAAKDTKGETYSGKRQGIRTGAAAISESSDLTPQDRHYLNKAVLCLESQREWSALSMVGELTEYGYPFLPHPTGPKSGPKSQGGFLGIGGKKVAPKTGDWQKPIEPPILSYLYYRYLLNFPCLREAKLDFWQQRIQPFFDSFAERNLSSTQERSEVTKRRLLTMAFTRILGTYYGTCVTAAGASAPERPDVNAMKQIDLLIPGTMETMYQVLYSTPGSKKAGNYTTWVAVPEARSDGYVVVSRLLQRNGQPFFFAKQSFEEFEKLFEDLEQFNHNDGLRLPLLPPVKPSGAAPDASAVQKYLRFLILALSNPTGQASDSDLKGANERLEKFLLSSNLTVGQQEGDKLLDKTEADDKKAEADRKKWVEAGKKVNRLRSTWNMYKDALISADELDRSFATLKQVSKIENLPPVYKDAEEWALYWVANALYFVFVGGPNAKDLANVIYSIHKLLPYALMKTGLSLANPKIAIQITVNLVLGQPLGGNSLFQRIFSIVMNSDIKARRKDIKQIRESLDEDDLCDAINTFVYAEREEQEATREASYKAGEDILMTILARHGCSRDRVETVRDWATAYTEAGLNHLTVSGDAQARAGSPAAKYLELKKLLRNTSLKRDREQVLEIVMEPNTPRMVKSIIGVFYGAIYKIANATNLAARLGDLQAFLDDMLPMAAEGNPTQTEYLAVCRKHQQSLYFFIHEMHAQGGDMTKPIIEWSRTGLQMIREGIPEDPYHKNTSPRLGINYDEALRSVDGETRAEILREVRGIAFWTKWAKMHTDTAMRCLITAELFDVHFDRNELFASLKASDRELQAHIEDLRQRGDIGRREEDKVPWAWFAEDDVVNNPNEIKVDWKAEAAKQPKKAKKNKKKGRQDEEVVKPKEEWDATVPPAPRLQATKGLLEGYFNTVKKTLNAAKECQIK